MPISVWRGKGICFSECHLHHWYSWSVVPENTAWNQMAPICSQWGCVEDNQAT